MPVPISEDGRWWWDGTQWRTRMVEGPLDLFWFTTTAEWVPRIVVVGLIGLIPIVGSINTLGWTLAATDMARNRWKELPPAGFQYLERGVAPFVVGLVYGVLFLFGLGVLLIPAILLLATGRPSNVALGIGLILFMGVLVLAWWLISLYLLAAVIMAADRLGIARALDPRRLFLLARRNQDASVRVGVTYGAASLALFGVSTVVGFVVPFAPWIATIALPAIYAMVVPSLATFHVDAEPGPPPAQAPGRLPA